MVTFDISCTLVAADLVRPVSLDSDQLLLQVIMFHHHQPHLSRPVSCSYGLVFDFHPPNARLSPDPDCAALGSATIAPHSFLIIFFFFWLDPIHTQPVQFAQHHHHHPASLPTYSVLSISPFLFTIPMLIRGIFRRHPQSIGGTKRQSFSIGRNVSRANVCRTLGPLPDHNCVWSINLI